MAEFFKKTRKRAITALSLMLAASLSMGVLAACGDTTDTDDEDETTSTAVDTQLLKNGNFEYYSEQDTKLEDKRNIISTPSNWSFTSGSPSSNTRSGLIQTKDWWYFAKTGGHKLESIADAYAHWDDDDVTLYDRLKFFEEFDDEIDDLSSSSAEAKFFAQYSYSIDFEDVEALGEDFPDGLKLHTDKVYGLEKPVESDDEDENDEEEELDGGVLMIHNDRTSDGVRGTAQYYTSSTTITLEAGTAAEITAWVRTDKLYHYYESNDVEVSQRAGAYIGVINTVGGTTLDEMQIKNINTKGEWEQYTVYVRASTYATTTFRIKLGLGQGTSSDNRYEAVDGYAFFDDIKVEKFAATEYESRTEDTKGGHCDINSSKKDKIFDATELNKNLADGDARYNTFTLDLYGDESYDDLTVSDDNVSTGLTTEVSGSHTYESKIKGNDDTDIAGVMSYAELKTEAASNGYLENIFANDFDGKFPFNDSTGSPDGMPVIMLLSTSRAAYTATMTSTTNFTLAADSRMLISFFVKTSEIRSGKTGAAITLVDGENKTSISAFDSTTVATVDIDKEMTDIYSGWVQCFFFVVNETEDEKEFSLEFTLGPTSIAGSTTSDYVQGYAAFTNFKVTDLTKTQYSHASTNSRAVKVSLTASVTDSTKFDDAQASANIEKGLAAPSSFDGLLAMSNVFDQEGEPNEIPDGVYAGLLNRDYAANYEEVDEPWVGVLEGMQGDASDWWTGAFGDVNNASRISQQPLVLMNTNSEATASYGFATASTSLSASSARRISMRIKTNTTAYVYLVDTSKGTPISTILTPTMPKITYWYDDDGNIVKRDPSDDDYDEKKDILFYIDEATGLYTQAGANDGKYYANLSNYEHDDDDNLLTKSETIAFYYDSETELYYAYREKLKNGSYKYKQEVYDLADVIDSEYVRYTAPDMSDYVSVITVGNTQGSWVEVSFYVRTGSDAKNYRVEIWAGERNDGENNVFPANSYVFFDNYSGTESVSNYEGLRSELVDALLEEPSNQDANDEKKLKSELAIYYTFTFYDSTSYLRYDENRDVDGDKWTSYNQSAYSEGLLWLRADDTKGELTGTAFYSVWLDYSVVDVAVSPDPSESGSSNSSGSNHNHDDDDSNTNVLLIISSALLAFVLIFAVVAVIVRRILSKRPKTTKVKSTKRNLRIVPKAPAPAVEETPKEDETPKNDKGPYSE